MPSNAMKISQLEEKLAAMRETHGDLDVVLCVSELGTPVSVDGRNVNVAIELPSGQRLPRPALVFGLWQDEQGRLKSSPGQAYQFTAEGDDTFTYDRHAAPANVELQVWKRYLGLDRGYRDEEGRWFVYEGGAKPIQIVPEGILGWRIP